MGLLRMSTIFKYLNATPDSRCVREGEEVLFAKQLIMCGISDVENLCYSIIALCLQTSAITDKPHEIKGSFTMKEDVEINSFTCTCKAGQSGVCKHVSACLFYCNRNDISLLTKLSSTDVECYWKKSKITVEENYRPQPINEYKCIKAVKRVQLLTAEDDDFCLKELRDCQPASALFKHFSKTCGGSSSSGSSRTRFASCSSRSTTTFDSGSSSSTAPISGVVYDVLAHAKASKFLKNMEGFHSVILKTCCKNLLQMLSLHDREGAATITQRTDEWREIRRLRITGSTCYNLYTYSKGEWELKANRLFNSTPVNNKYTRHGIKYEKPALDKYKEQCNVGDTVIEFGVLICNVFPWLGFSPDGIVVQEGRPIKLVEIKCPYSAKNTDFNYTFEIILIAMLL